MYSSLGLVVVAFLWGATNPFIRKSSKGIRDVKSNSKLGQIWAEISYILRNWTYVLPWIFNQMGSLLYLQVLQHNNLSLAVPVTNSLSFVFTALTGSYIGEEPLNMYSILGISLVIAGTVLCYTDKGD